MGWVASVQLWLIFLLLVAYFAYAPGPILTLVGLALNGLPLLSPPTFFTPTFYAGLGLYLLGLAGRHLLDGWRVTQDDDPQPQPQAPIQQPPPAVPPQPPQPAFGGPPAGNSPAHHGPQAGAGAAGPVEPDRHRQLEERVRNIDEYRR